MREQRIAGLVAGASTARCKIEPTNHARTIAEHFLRKDDLQLILQLSETYLKLSEAPRKST
jgi:hypothetical protein